MTDYTIRFHDDWEFYFSRLDKAVRQKIMKKVLQPGSGHSSRHLQHGLPFFVEEAGQYRITFKVDEQLKLKRFYFVGDHKDYEKWYSSVKHG